ncbi:MAG TPA: hypothetical protein VFL86_00820 [Burkholderiaceae bacterium]|nr:hypothetical protein [Burkholderiaceae bacterium]
MNRLLTLKLLTLGLCAWAALPAHAGDIEATELAGTTSRLIVKYRDLPVQARLDARTLGRALTVAARFRMSIQAVSTPAVDAHVLQLDRCVPLKYATALASELEASDAQVEYAYPERSTDPANGTCLSGQGFLYATAR